MHLTSNTITWNYDYCNATTDFDDDSLHDGVLEEIVPMFVFIQSHEWTSLEMMMMIMMMMMA
jgi:hypothetical protein